MDPWEQAAKDYKASHPSGDSSASSAPYDTGDLWKEDAPAADGGTWNAMRHPTQGWIGQGVSQIGQGLHQLTAIQGVGGEHPGQADMPTRWKGGTNILRGAGTAALPVAIGAAAPALVGNPAAFLGGAALGTGGAILGGAAASYGTEAAGGSPEAQEFAGEAGSMLGGLGGGYLGSKLPNLFKVRIPVAVNRSIRPVPSNSDFTAQLPETLAAIKAVNPPGPRIIPGQTNPSVGQRLGSAWDAVQANNVLAKPKGFQPSIDPHTGESNLIPAIDKTIEAYQNSLESWMQRMDPYPVSGQPIVDATKAVAGQMLPSQQAQAGSFVDRAQMDYGKQFSTRELRDRLAFLNKLSNPIFRQSPEGQASGMADMPDAMIKAQRDAAADTLYKHLDLAGMGEAPREIQSRTGNLIDLKYAADRRTNASIAEQPLTAFGEAADPFKAKLRQLWPWGNVHGGLSFAEGSEGKSMPLLRRAFRAADTAASFPRPSQELPPSSSQLPPGATRASGIPDPSGPIEPTLPQTYQLGPGNPSRQQLQLPGPSGMPQGEYRQPRGSYPQQGTGPSPLNVSDVSGGQVHPITPKGPINFAQVQAFAKTNDLDLDTALKVLSKTPGVFFEGGLPPGVKGYRRGGIVGQLPPSIRSRYAR